MNLNAELYFWLTRELFGDKIHVFHHAVVCDT